MKSTKPTANNQPLVGDSREQEGAPDLTFQPTHFERPSSDGESAKPVAPDPFDPASLRLSQETIGNLGVRETLVSIRCRKPTKEEFVRVHPKEDYRLQTYVLELKQTENELYLVAPFLWSSLAGEPTFGPRAFFTAISRHSREVFLWPCLLPKPDGKQPDWVTIPLEAARQAETIWTRVTWDESQRRHRIYRATETLSNPEWPDLSFRELLNLAFKDRKIETLDHPVLRKLRGEV
jgi:hypothetical protein